MLISVVDQVLSTGEVLGSIPRTKKNIYFFSHRLYCSILIVKFNVSQGLEV
jgi:hypothetical protein